jgi:hypothetical protein
VCLGSYDAPVVVSTFPRPSLFQAWHANRGAERAHYVPQKACLRHDRDVHKTGSTCRSSQPRPSIVHTLVLYPDALLPQHGSPPLLHAVVSNRQASPHLTGHVSNLGALRASLHCQHLECTYIINRLHIGLASMPRPCHAITRLLVRCNSNKKRYLSCGVLTDPRHSHSCIAPFHPIIYRLYF